MHFYTDIMFFFYIWFHYYYVRGCPMIVNNTCEYIYCGNNNNNKNITICSGKKKEIDTDFPATLVFLFGHFDLGKNNYFYL